mgnify:FL=1
MMDAVEDYARKWIKREPDEPELDTLSEWIKAIRSCIQRRIQKLRCNMSTRVSNPFKNPEVVDALSSLHDKYVVVPADKASNNIVFICRKHYLQCLTTELGIDKTTGILHII